MFRSFYVASDPQFLALSFPGDLVYERIKGKSVMVLSGTSKEVPLPDNFTPEQVPESAKETCRNWFFKVASIRELIPRLYPLRNAILSFEQVKKSFFYRF